MQAGEVKNKRGAGVSVGLSAYYRHGLRVAGSRVGYFKFIPVEAAFQHNGGRSIQLVFRRNDIFPESFVDQFLDGFPLQPVQFSLVLRLFSQFLGITQRQCPGILFECPDVCDAVIFGFNELI